MYMPQNNGTDFAPPPAGTHMAACYRVVDLGTQSTDWQGETKRQHKVMMSWELSDEKMEDGKPFSVHQRYTFSSHEKSTFRQHLEAWRGAPFKESDFGPGGFDIRKVIGAPCLLTIVHNVKQGRTYANITGVAKLMKGMQTPPLVNAKTFLSLDPAEFDQAVFDGLSGGLRAIIEKSPEYQELKRPRGEPVGEAHDEHNPPDDQSIPF